MRLLHTVKEQSARSRDIITPTTDLFFRTVTPSTEAESRYGYVGENGQVSQIILEASAGAPTSIFTLNKVAFEQLGEKNGLDVRTHRRLQAKYPREHAALHNAIFIKEAKRQMVRVHLSDEPNYGIARGYLSESFKCFDNAHVLKALEDALQSDLLGMGYEVMNATITEQRMYLRLRSRMVTGEASKGDVMAMGMLLSNSECGKGSVLVAFLIWTLACTNGMQTMHKDRQAHLTSARGTEEARWLSTEAIEQDNKLMALKTRDLIKAYGTRELFDETLEKMRLAAEDVVHGTVKEAVNNLGSVLRLTQSDTESVMEGLISTMQQPGFISKPVSRATLVNAVTACGNTADPDKVDEWQRLGGRVLELGKSEWERVALAA